MKIHESITDEMLEDAMQESLFGTEDIGFCIDCGEEHYNIEPDAEAYECNVCRHRAVYGAESLFMMVV